MSAPLPPFARGKLVTHLEFVGHRRRLPMSFAPAEAPMNWITEDRGRLLEGLDRAERAVTAFYRVLLWLVIAVVVAVVACVIIVRPWGEGHQGEWF